MDELLQHLRAPDSRPLVVTGAGISVASGIRTFRGESGVWSADTMTMGTLRFFHRNPVKSWEWYLSRFDGCRGAVPNAAHHAITTLQQRVPGTKLITQNIDGLHVKSGAIDVVEIHGAARKMRCAKRSCVHGAPAGFLDWDDDYFAAFRADPKFENLPRCKKCRSLIRAHVLWFDENYLDHDDYRMLDAGKFMEEMTVCIFIGTSFSVGITDHVCFMATNKPVPVFVIDPNDVVPRGMKPYSTHIRESSETFLPKLVEAL